MSRSIHTTNRSLAKLKRKKFPSEEARTEAISEARSELARKRRLKKQVFKERHLQAPVAGRTTPQSVPIEIMDQGPYVHHAISEADIRSILALLPAESSEGIEAIRLSLGSEYMAQSREEVGGVADPYIKRFGTIVFPGVYSDTVLGTYRPSRGWVSVYAYVVDPSKLLIPRVLCDLYLRLQALKTLVHEVAHFHDKVARVRRGRWLSDRKENQEWYAEKMEHQWTAELVIPYLEKRYEKECRAFQLWMKQRGGIDLPLKAFAGDPRRTERNGLTRLVCSTATAFELWVEELPQCASLEDAHLAMAWQLHYADQYEECLFIVNRVLNRLPNNLQALACRADTLIHLERLDEALADADTLLSADPTLDAGWETRASIQEDRKQWSEVLETCSRWASLPRRIRSTLKDIHRYRAIAHCALGDALAMHNSISAHLSLVRFKDEKVAKRRAYFFKKSIYRRAGQPLPPELLADFKP